MCVLAPITNTVAAAGPSVATSQTSAANKGGSRAKKSDGLLKSNGTTSARNFYVIDYLAQHGETSVNDFKLIWDNLPAETLKEYKARSAQAKKTT